MPIQKQQQRSRIAALRDGLPSLSLKTRLIALLLGLFVVFIWIMATVSITVLQRKFEQVLLDEQLASTQRLAADLDIKLRERVEALTRVASRAPAHLETQTLERFLADFPAAHTLFSAGIAVIGTDGKTIADHPAAPGRRGTYFGDRDYFRMVMESGQPYIDKPIIGRALKRPVLAIGVPIFAGDGKVRAVMTGITDLTAPNFLGKFSEREMTGKGDLYVISPHEDLFIASTDASLAMTALPARGADPMIDRFREGFEGTGIGRSTQGVMRLYSGKRIAASRWVAIAALPADIALGPVRAMRESLYIVAVLMTALAVLVFRWVARGMLAPLSMAGAAMRSMVGGQTPLAPLPLTRQDEIGDLIGSFNLLVQDRERHETALKDSEQRLQKLVESAPDAIIVRTGDRFAYLNSAALRLFGAPSPKLLLGTPVLDRVHPDYRTRVQKRIAAAESAQVATPPADMQFLRLDGTAVDVEVSAVPVQYDGKESLLVFARDVTERKRAEAMQRKLNRALRMLSDCNMALIHAEREQSLLDEICRLLVHRGGYRLAWVGYMEHDEASSVRVASQSGMDNGYLDNLRISWSDATAYGRGPVGTAIREGRVQVVQDFHQHPSTLPWRDAARERGFRSSIALPLHHAGRTFGALAIYAAEADSFGQDEVRLLYELATDLAFGIATLRTRIEREAAEEKLAFLAHHDPLTHLPNRVLLRDRFDRAISSAQRARSGVALLILDLDNFKQVNDGFGHEVGDQLLLQVVARLQQCIRDTDTVSRHGGDEFVILLNGVPDSGMVSRIAQSVLDVIAEPFDIGPHAVNISMSIGISLYPEDGGDFDTLLKNADTALYHAKDNGRDTYHFFAGSMNVDALARIELHGNLRKAIKNREFVLHYQPQIDIATGTIVGVEALVRWHRPDSGLVPPGRFIPLAEESGLIVPIGDWVMREACRQAVSWQAAGMPPLRVAVNLSPQQFKRGDIVATVRSALAESGLPAELLELELTESTLLQDTATVMETLHRLKEIGVYLSIDDFGTGYSSLAYLRRLAVDKLKIDQSFVRDVPVAADGAAIVKAIIQLGHALQLDVIAEGVETEKQLDFLRRQGCDQAQGYLVSRPLPAPEFAEFAGALAGRRPACPTEA